LFKFILTLCLGYFCYFIVKNQEKIKKELEEKYFEFAAAEMAELNENIQPFNCDICMEENIGPFLGVVLKECLHIFCKY